LLKFVKCRIVKTEAKIKEEKKVRVKEKSKGEKERKRGKRVKKSVIARPSLIKIKANENKNGDKQSKSLIKV